MKMPIKLSTKKWLIAALAWPAVMLIVPFSLRLAAAMDSGALWGILLFMLGALSLYAAVGGFFFLQLQNYSAQQINDRFTSLAVGYTIALALVSFVVNMTHGDNQNPIGYGIASLFLMLFLFPAHMFWMLIFKKASEWLLAKNIISILATPKISHGSIPQIIDTPVISEDHHDIPDSLSANQYLLMGALFSVLLIFLPCSIGAVWDGSLSMGGWEAFLALTFPPYALAIAFVLYKGWNKDKTSAAKLTNQLPIVYALLLGSTPAVSTLFNIAKIESYNIVNVLGVITSVTVVGYITGIVMRALYRFFVSIFWN